MDGVVIAQLAPEIDPNSVRARVYLALFAPPGGSRVARSVEIIIYGLILLNVAAIVLGSMDRVAASVGPALLVIEFTACAVFSVEYVLRIWCITADRRYRQPIAGRCRYALTFFALVDLASILPPYAALVGANFRVVSVVRMLRLLKLGRYSVAMQTLTAVFVGKRREVFASMLILLGLLLMASCGIYLAEGEAQPEFFGSIPQSLWWSVTTVTTVGYGDVTPITLAGKVFTGIVAVVSLLTLAIPTGIVSAGFFEEFKRLKPPVHCSHCGKSTNHHH